MIDLIQYNLEDHTFSKLDRINKRIDRKKKQIGNWEYNKSNPDQYVDKMKKRGAKIGTAVGAVAGGVAGAHFMPTLGKNITTLHTPVSHGIGHGINGTMMASKTYSWQKLAHGIGAIQGMPGKLAAKRAARASASSQKRYLADQARKNWEMSPEGQAKKYVLEQASPVIGAVGGAAIGAGVGNVAGRAIGGAYAKQRLKNADKIIRRKNYKLRKLQVKANAERRKQNL